jgi:hypothetical protein
MQGVSYKRTVRSSMVICLFQPRALMHDPGTAFTSLIDVKIMRAGPKQQSRLAAMQETGGFAFVPIGVAWAHGIGGCRTHRGAILPWSDQRQVYVPHSRV